MEEVLEDVPGASAAWEPNPSQINMNEIVGSHDILFVCLDTLRWDVARREEARGATPVLNRYGNWKKCHAPGSFTYPSHHAMFAGFLPSPAKPAPLMRREMLFFPKNIGLGKRPPEKSFAFDGATWIEGLAKVGYQTICIGGVAFFDRRSDIGKVFPAMFQHSYWNPSFGCTIKDSADRQVDFAADRLARIDPAQRVMMYLNIDAIHYPNFFYLDGAKKDNIETHAAALRYVDGALDRLFAAFKQRGKTFVIVCSDHGTCYGEDGYEFHAIAHEVVYTVPYKHFILERQI